MNEQSNWLVHDHNKYDAILTECEMAAEMADWKDAIRLFNDFISKLKLHMQLEDEVLYPLFEKNEDDPNDEIPLLHEEHDNIVRLLRDLVCIIKTKNIDHFIESLSPLHKALNEHNAHEEDVFQRLGNNSLLMNRDEIMKQLSAVQEKKGHKSRDWSF